MLLTRTTCSFTLGLLVICHTAAQYATKPFSDVESVQCTGSGMLVFQGEGRFSIVRESGKGNVTCTGEVSVTATSELYTRIITEQRNICMQII